MGKSVNYTGKEYEVMETKPYEMNEVLKRILDRKKGLVCNEFEKVCPTDVSLKRVVKDMHDIFDSLEKELKETFNI
jgi:hypothetical protein